MNKQYLDVEFKSDGISEDGFFMGYGSTFGGEPDSYGDVIDKGAFTESINTGGRNKDGIAMLWQHNTTIPIGVWTDIVEDSKGLKVTGQLEIKSDFGKRIYNLLKMGAVDKMSIGFDTKGIKDAEEFDEKTKIRHIKKVNLWEISLVTFPSNTNATITGIKSIEDCRTARELEGALRELGNSKSVSQYIVKHFDLDTVRELQQKDVKEDVKTEEIITEEVIVEPQEDVKTELTMEEYLKMKERILNGGS